MSASTAKPRILVVDDEPAMRHTLDRVLRRLYDVVCAESGEAALRLLPGVTPDLAVVDVRMPGINGFELTRRLKQHDPALDVILMTGNVEEPDDNLVRAIDEGAFYFIHKPFDRRVLLTLVNRCLELRRLRAAESRHVARLEAELSAARQFQQSLMPPPRKQLAGVSINARYLACNELAGDIYDYARAGEHSVAVLVADVVGHGASAAMMTSMVKSAFHAAAGDHFEPLAVVERVKQGLRPFDGSRFVTLISARLNTVTRELDYVNGGHPPAILHANGQDAVLLEPTGPLLSSALYDLPHQTASVRLGPEQSLLLYTDGVTETVSESGLFGQQRMLSLLAECACSGERLLDRILAALSDFAGHRPQQDDITLLALDPLGA